MPICKGCGASYDDEFKFCPYCGRAKPDRIGLNNNEKNIQIGVNKTASELAIQRLRREIAGLEHSVTIGITGSGWDIVEKLRNVPDLDWDLAGYIEQLTGKRRRLLGQTLSTSAVRGVLVGQRGEWNTGKALSKPAAILNIKQALKPPYQYYKMLWTIT